MLFTPPWLLVFSGNVVHLLNHFVYRDLVVHKGGIQAGKAVVGQILVCQLVHGLIGVFCLCQQVYDLRGQRVLLAVLVVSSTLGPTGYCRPFPA